ncbi:ATP-binding protein [Streptomyces sp. NPDC091292]|uniref:ATP-binding protein n=1 Tax=Streptomyces sp. NPDC091292 TaxID=3365991 RepID=UPI0037F36CBB
MTMTDSVALAVARTDLGRHPTAARCARIWARGALREWQVCASVVPDVELVVSEYVSNALLHARGAIRAELVLLRDGRWLRVEVHDAGPCAGAAAWPGREHHGRGLQITGALAVHSGRETTPERSRAWAELAIPAPPDPK